MERSWEDFIGEGLDYYQQQYGSLIEQARERDIGGYVETHHIIPRCMGGSDDRSNLLRLRPEEHFDAHVLLTRIYPNHRGLRYAIDMMSDYGRMTRKDYGKQQRRKAREARDARESRRFFVEVNRFGQTIYYDYERQGLVREYEEEFHYDFDIEEREWLDGEFYKERERPERERLERVLCDIDAIPWFKRSFLGSIHAMPIEDDRWLITYRDIKGIERDKEFDTEFAARLYADAIACCKHSGRFHVNLWNKFAPDRDADISRGWDPERDEDESEYYWT
jgi:hypothetical protein